MRCLNHRSHALAKISEAEVLTVAVVAAKYFHNNHERALWVLTQLGYLSEPLSTSRFNRRLHAVADWLPLILETLGELFAQGTFFIIDSTPLPVCGRARARRNRKVRGRDYCGYCAAKKEKFFGFRLHLVCTRRTPRQLCHRRWRLSRPDANPRIDLRVAHWRGCLWR
jgi:hypothetical protein